MRALVLVGLAACSPSKKCPPTECPKCDEAKPPRATMKHECVLSKEKVGFWVIFPIHYSKSSVGPMDKRYAYFMSCDRAAKTCAGDYVDIGDIEAGKPLSIFDFGHLDDAKIKSEVGKVFVIQWGPLRTFTVDFERGEVAYLESNENTDGRGVIDCEPLVSED